ncbi:unnamed protein product, partial [Chrysoparadoxa australica]
PACACPTSTQIKQSQHSHHLPKMAFLSLTWLMLTLQAVALSPQSTHKDVCCGDFTILLQRVFCGVQSLFCPYPWEEKIAKAKAVAE